MIVYGSSGLTAAMRAAISAASRPRPRSRSSSSESAPSPGSIEMTASSSGSSLADGGDLGHLRGVLADDEARLGVAGHPRALRRASWSGRSGTTTPPAAGDRESPRTSIRAGSCTSSATRSPCCQPEVDQPAVDLRDRLARARRSETSHHSPSRLNRAAGLLPIAFGGQAHDVRDRRRPRTELGGRRCGVSCIPRSSSNCPRRRSYSALRAPRRRSRTGYGLVSPASSPRWP